MRKLILIIYLLINTADGLVKEDNLYSANVPVLSREIDDSQRKRLVEEAWVTVLQKITGKIVVMKMNDVDKYLSKYAYNDVANDQVVLTINFDKNAINKYLIENNYKFMGEHRPLTIIWSKSSDINQNQELLQSIRAVAQAKGLSIVYPMLDMVDLEVLQHNVDDLQQFKIILQQASKRYAADEIIFVQSNRNQDKLQFDWQSFTSVWQLKTEGVNWQAQANLLIDSLMEQFIKRYVGSSDSYVKELEKITIKITNIIDLEDYVRVENYLQNLSFIKNLHAAKFQAGEVEFELKITGNKETLRNAISNSNILQELNQQNMVEHNNNVLFYTFRT